MQHLLGDEVDDKVVPPTRRCQWFHSILDVIGSTPLSKLNKIPQSLGLKANFYVKLDYLSVSGSSADRAALRYIEAAEEDGLAAGNTVIAPASGNLAVAIALVCAARGYKCVIVAESSQEKDVTTLIQALGATVISTNGGDSFNLARSYQSSISQGYFLDTVKHDASVSYRSLASEIIDVLEGKISMIVVPEGDGALPAGIAYYVKDNALNVKVVAVKNKDTLKVPELESSLTRGILKKEGSLYAIHEAEAEKSFLMARRLIREEGVCCGAATGAALVVASNEARDLLAGENIVIVATDGITNYMRHFLDDEWLYNHKIISEMKKDEIKPKKDYDKKWVEEYNWKTQPGKWEKKDGNWKSCQYEFNPFRPERPRICENVLGAVGNTPLVRLNRLPKLWGLECNIFVKCEFLNAGGSTKDRIVLRMIELAEKEGKLKPGMTLIEPTSGNTGVGIALAAAVKNYKAVIVTPVKTSHEKQVITEAFGAAVVRTPNGAAFDSGESHFGVTLRLKHEIPDSFVLDQYTNIGNSMSHYEQTAEEIIESLGGDIQYLFVGAGTGGSMTGIGRKFEEKIPKCKVMAVDPAGSVLACGGEVEDEEAGCFEVEGVGYDFVPGILDRNVVEDWVKSTDKDAFLTARELIRNEGILCGGSSGTNLHAALSFMKKLNLPPDVAKKTNVVVILPDGVRNYLTKFLDDEWLSARNIVLPPMP